MREYSKVAVLAKILVQDGYSATDVELGDLIGTSKDGVRSLISVLRREGYNIAKEARISPFTGKMMKAKYYNAGLSEDILNIVRYGRTARSYGQISY